MDGKGDGDLEPSLGYFVAWILCSLDNRGGAWIIAVEHGYSRWSLDNRGGAWILAVELGKSPWSLDT